MEDFNITDFFENVTDIYNKTDYSPDEEDDFFQTLRVVTWIIIGISLPLTLVALYLLVRDKHVLVYVINLLISGVIQFCCLIAITTCQEEQGILISTYCYWYAEISSINFMVCVALERYLAIAHPLWYRFSRSIKIYVVVCVVVWLLPIVYLVVLIFSEGPLADQIAFSIIHLLPFPIFLFFLVGAIRALSAAIHLNSVEKRRIIGTLVLPILTYLLLFSPFIILLLREDFRNKVSDLVTFIFLFLSPLANVILYVIIRKGFMDKVLVFLCCFKMDKNENSTGGTVLSETAEK